MGSGISGALIATSRNQKKLETIWRVSDELWQKKLIPILNEYEPPKRVGRLAGWNVCTKA